MNPRLPSPHSLQDGVRVAQSFHRLATPEEAKFTNADGTIFMGIAEIFQSRNITRGVGVPKSCSKKRRRELQFPTDMMCPPGENCCCNNILRNQPDFMEQKHKLEEVTPPLPFLKTNPPIQPGGGRYVNVDPDAHDLPP